MLIDPVPAPGPLADTAAGFQLSPQQRHLWRLRRLDGGCTDGVACRIEVGGGALDAARLRAAMAAAVARHEILRTRFRAVPGLDLPLQVVEGRGRAQLRLLDLANAAAAEQERQLEQLLAEAARAGADPAGEPRLEVTAVRLAADRAVLICGLPALRTDAAGLRLLAGELARGYASPATAATAGAAPLQYADAAEWQNDLLAGDAGRDEREAWRRRWSAVAPAPPLPQAGDRAPRGGAFAPAGVRRVVAGLGRRLAAAGAPPAALLLAAWQALLARLTGASEVTVATLFDGRSYEDLADAVGLFARALPIGSGPLAGETFDRLARRLAAALAEAGETQEYAAVDAGAPLAYGFEHTAAAPPLALAGLTWRIAAERACLDRHLLALRAQDEADGAVAFDLRFDAAVLAPAEARRLLGQLEALTEAALLAPRARLADLPLLAGDQEAELAAASAGVPLPAGGPRQPIHRQVAAWARRAPLRQAVECAGASLTYAELDAAANRLAHLLIGRGTRPGERIALLLRRSLDLPVAMLAALKAGAAFAPLDPDQPDERLAAMLADLDPRLVLTHRGLAAGLPRRFAAAAVQLDRERDAAAGQPDTAPAAAGLPLERSLAYVIFTSGSTGRPKGVGIEHAQLGAYLAAIVARLELPEGARHTHVSTFAADLGHTVLLPALATGGTLHVVTEDQMNDGEALAAELAARPTDCLKIVPTHLASLLAAAPRPEQLLPRRRLVLGGEAAPAELIGRLRALAPAGCRIFNHYGPTETTVGVLVHEIAAAAGTGTGAAAGGRPPLGRPLAGVSIHILDGGGRRLPFWAAGELCIGGATVGRGYLGRPELTAERFVPDPWGAAPGARLYRTGDLARRRSDGCCEFLGRIDDQLKLRGYRIEPGEIASQLLAHPAVAEAAVVLRDDGPQGAALVAYWTPRAAAPAADLRAWLAARLPAYMVPSAFVELRRLPVTRNGKLDRQALPAPAHGESGGGLPRNPTEEILAGIWAAVLGREQVGVHDDFFALGGHSLLATQVVSRIRRVFQVELPLRRLLDGPTVAALALAVSAAGAGDATGAGPRRPAAPPIAPAARDRPLPLSFAQQRLWFLHQLEPDGGAYNVPLALRLRGALRPPVLAASLAEIVRRHEALRTTFVQAGGEPRQQWAPPRPVALPVIDLGALGAAERRRETLRLALAEAQGAFDLERGPLLRARLLAQAPGEHVVLLTLHHIVCDGWSLGLMLRELAPIYQALAAGRRSPLAPPALQYADFAEWQRRWLAGEVLAAEVGYWRDRLAALPPLLTLPTDRPRPAVQTFRGASLGWRCAPPLTAALRRLGRAQGATLFMGLAAAFAALLHRHSGQEQIAIGTPIANRNHLQTEGIVGVFVNTLVLCADLRGGPSFGELLERMRDTTLSAYDHQDLPFEKLVAELQPERNLAWSPLFQVMLTLGNLPIGELTLPHVVAERLTLPSGTAKFALNLMLQEELGGVSGTAELNRDLFDPATIARLLGQLTVLLGSATADPGRPVGELALLTAAETAQLLDEWNDTRAPFAAAPCIHERFAEQAERTPLAPAVVQGGTCLTYGELERRANRLAHRLAALGAAAGSLVGVFVERTPDMVTAVLAVLKSGAAYVPLDGNYPVERIAWILERLGVRILITHAARQPTVAAVAARAPLAHVQWLDGGGPPEAGAARSWDAASLAGLPDTPLCGRATSDDPAYVIFTSGTTGTPKGVTVCHRPVGNLIEWVNRTFQVGAGDRLLFLTSLCFDLSVYDIFGVLAAGGCVRVASADDVRDPLRLIAILLAEPITFWDSAPAALQQLAPFLPDGPQPGSAHLRLVFQSGDWIPVKLPDAVRRAFPRARFIALGGATEATVWSNFFPVGRVEPDWASIPYGRPIQNARYHALDLALAPCPIGVAGDLYIGGDCLFTAYAGEAALTADKLRPDPTAARQGRAGARIYRTGDRVRHFADGVMEFLGRSDHQVKVRGFRIELGEIEAVLALHPQVRAAVAMVRQDEPGDRRLVAYVVADPGQEPAPAELRAHLEERLPSYMLPAALVTLAALPLTQNGKLDRQALPRPAAAAAHRPAAAAPRSPAERILAAIWADVLHQGEVGIHDNFFELGGDSILSIQIISRANRQGLRLEPRHIFLHPTVAQLAAAAETAGAAPELALAAAAADAAAAEPAGPIPATPIQRWLLDQHLPRPDHFNQALLLELQPAAGVAADSAAAGAVVAAGAAAGRLRSALAQVVARHAALRLRLACDGAAPPVWQPPAGAADPALPGLLQVDLAALPPPRRAAAVTAAAAQTQASLDLAAGTLLRAACFDLGSADRPLLLLVAHHLAVDGVSWRIVLEDLEALYRQPDRPAAGEPAAPPPPAASFAAWAARLAHEAASPELDAQAAWWIAALRQAPAVAADLPGPGNGAAGSARDVIVTLDEAVTRALLRDAQRAYRTQVNDLLLAALLDGFARLTGSHRLLLDLEGHGRRAVFPGLDVSRTVGWFTTLLPVLLDVPRPASPGELVKAVKEQLRAVAGREIGFGLLRHLASSGAAAAVRALPRPAVVFNYLGQLDGAAGAERLFAPAALDLGPLRDPRQPRPWLLEINCGVLHGRLQVRFTYSDRRHRRDTVERLAGGFQDSLAALLAHCLQPEAGGATPGDLPLARLSQAEIDGLEAAGGALDDAHPATAVQQGLLFHSLQRPGAGFYLGQLSLRLGRELDPAAFAAAWQRLVARQPVLRSAFVGLASERPLQIVYRRVSLDWRRHDLRGLAAAARDERLAELLAADRRRDFDTARAPLLRLALCDLGEAGWQFVCTFHFALLDGWSMPILLRELFAFYQDALAGAATPLAPPPTFRDYAAWLADQDMAAAESYWRGALAGIAGPTPLPLALPAGDAGRTTHAEDGGARGGIRTGVARLAPETSERLRAAARRQGLTPSTLVQAAWAVLLARHAGAREVVFGAVTAGRSAPVEGIDSIVGLFINTLPVRVAIDPREPVADWLARLQQQQAEARRYEHAPLAEVQRFSGAPAGQALFDSIVIYENYPVDAAIHQRAARLLDVGSPEILERTSYPLSVFVAPGPPLSAKLACDAARFEAAAAARLAGHFEQLLAALAGAGMPGGAATVGDLSPLSAAELHQLVREWNDTRLPRPAACVHRLFEAQVDRTPMAVAVVGEQGALSFAELDRRANRLARRLRRLGVGPDVPVAIAADRSLELMVGLVAILKAGGAYVPLDPSYPEARLAAIAADAAAGLATPVVVAQQALADRLDAGRARVVRLDGAGEAEAPRSDSDSDGDAARLRPSALPANLAYVLHTSGSTGRPKGVMNSHAGICNFLAWLAATYGIGPGDGVLLKTPLGFDVSVWELFLPLATGATLVLARPGGHQDPAYLAQVIVERQATVAHFVPSALQVFVDEPAAAGCVSLRHVMASGEALTGELRRRYQARVPGALHNLYGPTEAAIDVSSHACSPDETGAAVSIGRPLANAAVHLLDADLAAVPAGVPAELLIGGVCLARGYLHRPDLTAERFVPHPWGEPGSRLYRTGDLCRRDGSGQVEFLGRIDHQVKIRGVRVELGEIEAVLGAHPAVQEAVVLALAAAADPADLRLTAYVVPRSPRPADLAAALRAHLAELLPEPLRPQSFVWLDAMPRTPSEKADRQALARLRPQEAETTAGARTAPRTPTEELLAALWAELLDLPGPGGIGIQDSFFELGGHSLLAVRLGSRVRDRWGIELPVQNVFAAADLAALAAHLDERLRSGLPAAPPLAAVAWSGPARRAPLSYAQRRLWFLDQLEPGSCAFHLAAALRLSGRLDIAALRFAAGLIVRRHETLRTTFEAVDGEPWQVVAAAGGAGAIALCDLSRLATGAAASEVERLAAAAMARPFDLGRGPLLRLTLLRLAAREHLLLAVFHHIVGDGWSTGVLVRELGEIYTARAENRPPRLPELAVQYADYAIWQRAAEDRGLIEAQLDWWREQLAGAPVVLELPADRAAGADRRGPRRAASLPLFVPAAAAEALRGLARQGGATLFMTLLAAFQTLLARYTGQTDLLVGTPVANRGTSQIEGLIGFFVNSLALRLRLDPGQGAAPGAAPPGFAALLARARAAALGAYAHQELAFERLVEALRIERSRHCHPLFQVILVLQNAAGAALRMPDVTLEPVPLPAAEAKTDLVLSLAETARWEGPLTGAWEYDAGRFDAATVRRLGGHLLSLIAAAAAAPATPWTDLPLLTGAERQQAIELACGPAPLLPAGATVPRLFAEQAALRPDAVAIVRGREAWTYGHLARQADRISRWLLALGVRREERVAVCLAREPHMIAALLGILAAGAAYLPLDASYPPARRRWLAADAGARLVLADSDAEPDEGGPGVVRLAELAGRGEPAAAPPPPAGEADALAYVMYTSGSTGAPKGVEVTHRNIVRLVRDAGFAAMGAGETWLQLAPVSFDAATLEIWAPLLNGGRLVLAPAGERPSLAELEETLAGQQVTSLWLTAGLFHAVADERPAALRPLRQLLVGGDVVSPAHARRVLAALPHLTLINGYGPTEGTTFSCTHRLAGAAAGAQVAEQVPIGRPIAHAQARVLDGSCRPVPPGVAGELFVGGAGVARGYLRRPDLTAERFVPDPAGGAGERLYRTGDRVRRGAAGALEFLGRLDRQLKVRGFRVEPAEVEAALAALPGVGAAAVVVREDPAAGRTLVAAVVAVPQPAGAPATHGASLEPRRLAAALAARLPAAQVPAEIVVVEALPLTANGKVDRRELARRLAAPAARADAAQPLAGGLEEQVAVLFAELLPRGGEAVHADTHFFAAGGHSLLAIRLLARLRQACDVELPVSAVFDAPTVRLLAAEVRQAQRRGGRRRPPLAAAPRRPPLPLSFAQQRLWFLDQKEPGLVAYNLPAAVRLRGPLAVPALAAALAALGRRHESLRTTFPSAAGEPQQRVAAEVPFALRQVELAALGEERRLALALALAGEEARRPFDLARGPLVRATLLALAPQDHVLLLNQHHIATDGWSLGIFLRELGLLYDALAAGRRPALPEPAVQYVDYTLWQRRWLSGEVLAEEVSWWRQQLAGAPPLLALPTDRPRPPVQGSAGRRLPLALPASDLAALHALSRQLDATSFIVLLAVFQALLCRYCGQQDVVVGTPVSGRDHPLLEEVIGFFANTLVLRTGLDGDPDGRQVVARARSAALGAFAHQEVPFEKLVAELRPERNTSFTPFFQAALVLNPPFVLPRLGGIAIEPLGADPGTAKFDLNLTLEESPDGLAGFLEYRHELFDAATMRRFAERFANLLRALAADPAQRLSRLPLLAGTERAELLAGWRWTAPPAAQLPLHRRFEAWAARTPAAPALAADGLSMSYGELNAAANRLARVLRRAGAGDGAPVGLCAERSFELVIGVLAILKAGGAYVPLDPAYPRQRLAATLTDALAGCTEAVLLAQGDDAAALAEGTPLAGRLRVVRLDHPAEGESAADLAGGPPAEAPAYVIFTSGSTGRPKGVAVTHASACRLFDATAGWFGFGAGDVWTLFHSFAFDFSVWEIWGALLHGGRLVVVPYWVSRSPEDFHRLLVEESVTVLSQTPSAFLPLAEADAAAPPGALALRWVIFGGEALEPRQLAPWIERHGDATPRLVNMYGITETTVHVTWRPVTAADVRAAGSPIGIPIPDLRLGLFDAAMEPVAWGAPGEIHVGGAGLATGYLGRPDLTAERFRPDPLAAAAGEPGGRLYRSGDLARRTAAGDLEYLGRIDHQVKIRGFRIEPGEIAATLAGHPAVGEAAVVAMIAGSAGSAGSAGIAGSSGSAGGAAGASGRSGATALAAFYAPAALGVEAARQHLKLHLPDHLLPALVVALEQLPRTPVGKVDAAALRQLAACSAAAPAAATAAPRTPLEEILAGLYAEVLDRAQVSANESFFDLGGHSLLATRLVSRVRETCGAEVSLAQLFEAPTVTGFAAVIERELRGGEARRLPLLARPRAGMPPLSFAQQRLWFLDQLQPGGVGWNMTIALRLRGPLRIAALAGALEGIVHRHEVLRTTFAVAADGEPRQAIAAPRALPLPLVDLRGLPPLHAAAAVPELLRGQALQPFDLARGPLLRASLLALADDEHLALFVLHHIICDAWSLALLVRELGTLYDLLAGGDPRPLAELPVQYADFAVWQRERLPDEVIAGEVAWWRGTLGASPPVLLLPADRPRPPLPTFGGARQPFQVESDLADRLRELSRRHGVTLFMTLLAAFQTLLGRYARQDEVLVGTPIAGRDQLETEALIGFFVNTLVLRGDLAGDPPFAALLGRTRELALAAYAHQELPFEKLVEELQPERRLNLSPIFQVMFALQNVPAEQLSLSGLTFEALPVDNPTTQFDLTLVMAEAPGRLDGFLEYRTDLFDAATVEHMTRALVAVLAAAAETPDLCLSRLPLLPRVPLAAAAALTGLPGGGGEGEHRRPVSVPGRFAAWAERAPAAPALYWGGEIITYGALARRAQAVAARLTAAGIGAERRVGLAAQPSPDLVAGLLGIWYAGAAFVPLDPDYPGERLRAMIGAAGLAALLVDSPDGAAAAIAAAAGVPRLAIAADPAGGDDGEGGEGGRAGAPLAAPPAAEQAAYVIFTSGSTGTPKGVVGTHGPLANFTRAIGGQMAIGPGDRVLLFATVSFDASMVQLFPALAAGAALVLHPRPRALAAGELLDFCQASGATVLDLPVALWRQMADEWRESGGGLPPAVRLIMTGGEALPAAALRGLGAALPPAGTFIASYGPTETTVTASACRLSGADIAGLTLAEVPLGEPLDGVRLHLLDPHLQPVPHGCQGEVFLGGAGVTRGYLDDAALTAERFIPDPWSGRPGGRLYVTGDMARRGGEGALRFLGRRDRQVKVRGHRIDLAEIEAALAACAGVRDCAAVVGGDAREPLLVGYVTPQEGAALEAAEVRGAVAARLPAAMVPAAIVVLPVLPRQPSGKLDRRALPAPERSAATRPFRAPSTPLEAALCRLCAELLQLDQVGLDDEFFALGGHSLLAVRLSGRVRARLGVEMPLRLLFESRNLGELAAALAARQGAALDGAGGAIGADGAIRAAASGSAGRTDGGLIAHGAALADLAPIAARGGDGGELEDLLDELEGMPDELLAIGRGGLPAGEGTQG